LRGYFLELWESAFKECFERVLWEGAYRKCLKRLLVEGAFRGHFGEVLLRVLIRLLGEGAFREFLERGHWRGDFEGVLLGSCGRVRVLCAL
jgi:hypothetical protein